MVKIYLHRYTEVYQPMAQIKDTQATKKIFGLKKRIRAVCGGCLSKGTPVLMYDLTTKPVEDVCVGDTLIGPDSKPRKVLSLYRGKSQMYEVEQLKGDNYTVNDKHILVFEDQGRDVRETVDGVRKYKGRVHESGYHKFTAEEFFNGSWRSTGRRFKAIKASLDFPNQKVGLDPYFLGLWLGDGISMNAAITNVDKEVIQYLYTEIPQLYDVNAKAIDDVTTSLTKNNGKYNEIIQQLKKYNLILNKHIPSEYIKNSRRVRLQLLAGLIDSDGCLSKDSRTGQSKGYYITQKRKDLSDDILLLARSLGYYATQKTRISKMKRDDGSVYECETYTVAIFAKDYREIPVKVGRKKCLVVNAKNPLRSSVRLHKRGVDNYYGFELDSDHLFLLGDFTITHNTSASKTISILIWIIDYCQSSHNKRVDVMSESYPHLNDGAIKDFKMIMMDSNYWNDDRWNKTEHTYTFETGTTLKFISIDRLGKAHGPRRDVLFINEANNIAYAIYEQLEVRTKDVIWLDWNPSTEFWYYSEIKDKGIDHDFLRLTYLDCLEVLPKSIVDSIESKKSNKNWWKVYGEGKLGEVEGRIYTGWTILDDIPIEAILSRRGLDFGYSNDPTATVDVYKYQGGFILDEGIYQKGLKNGEIATILKNKPAVLTIADSSEPKSIDEISEYGVLIIGATKGQGSVNQGIQYVQSQKIYVTKRSIHLIKEYRNYMWETDRNGKILNVPVDMWNHCMDATRYALDSFNRDDDEYDELPTYKPSDDVIGI